MNNNYRIQNHYQKCTMTSPLAYLLEKYRQIIRQLTIMTMNMKENERDKKERRVGKTLLSGI